MLTSPESLPAAIEPQASFTLDGLLHEASPQATTARVVSDTKERLAGIVRLLIDWGDVQKVEAHVGDYRFLVLNFTGEDGIVRFVQIWAEPALQPIIEVGPGQRSDPRRQSVADAMAPAMTERGFLIAGKASNFRTRFRVPSPEDAETLSMLLMDLLTNVCGYEGRTDLHCNFQQETHGGSTHVMHHIRRERLMDMLDRWGFRVQPNPQNPHSVFVALDVCVFEILLMSSVSGDPDRHTEIHCFTAFGIRHGVISEVLHQVNNRPNFVRAWPLSVSGKEANPIKFTTGIELYGGVTPYHLRFRLQRWVSEVKAIRSAFVGSS